MIGDQVFYQCKRLDEIAIPICVTNIGYSAFFGCESLEDITFSHNLRFLDRSCFSRCTNLRSATFIANAPAGIDPDTFKNSAAEFTIRYLSSSTGFTSPTWHGYPTEVIDVGDIPAAAWLLGYGLPLDADLNQDLNGDGVSLLMAYALNLNPLLNLRASLPVPVLRDATLGISFYAAAEGITYSPQTSRDLQAWTSAGVAVSEPDAAGRRTASVDIDSKVRFLRLVVEE